MKKLLILFTLVFLSCVEAEDVESIIIDNNSKWVEYYNQGDAKGIASLHTNDAVVIPPKADFVVGRDNIEQMYKSEIKMLKATLDLKTTEVIHEEIHAYETGLYSIQVKQEGAKNPVGYEERTKNLKALHKSASKVFAVPDFETFIKEMQDEDKLLSFSRAMGGHYTMPNLDKLKADIGFVGITKTIDKGKYIVIWEKQKNGDWLCKKDIWNTSLVD